MSSPVESENPTVKKVDLESGNNTDTQFATNEKVPSDTNNLHDGTSIEAEPVSLEVYWNEPVDEDPANPMNWPSRKKWASIAVLSSITFLTFVPFLLPFPARK
jgi:hypothetical protein